MAGTDESPHCSESTTQPPASAESSVVDAVGRRLRRGGYVLFVVLLALGVVLSPAFAAGGAATLPAVTTEPATDVTTTTATLEGNLTEIAGDEATVWFQYWEQGNRSSTTEFAGIQPRDTAGPFDAEVTGLERNTTYVFVAHAKNDNGTVSGIERTFTAAADLRVGVATEPASEVTDNSARLAGSLETLTGAAEADVWFQYWEQGNRSGTLTRTPNQTLDATGPFSSTVYGLQNNTTYIVRAYAAAGEANATGAPVTFTTATDTDPSITTLQPGSRDPDAATLRANLTDLGGAESASVYFQFWQQGERDETTQPTGFRTVEGPSEDSTTVSGLENDTTYVYVAFVRAADDDGNNGAPVAFTTTDRDRPAVVTQAATAVTADAATLNGELSDLGDAAEATVQFAYWEASAKDETLTYTDEVTRDGPGDFDARIADLDDETTYVFIALANGSDGDNATGTERQFTTDAVDDPEDAGDQRGPGDESGPGDEHGPGDEEGKGDERGPGDEYGPGDEHGPGQEHGPGKGSGPEEAGPPEHARNDNEDDDNEDDDNEDDEDGDED